MSSKQSQYKILKSLEKDPNYTQRQLSSDLDISLGGVNYCLKG
ncbi:winged helix-turn-helix transcriptional regulator, partial [bacterium]|nr:winged helix-turn-helix transcriptional regulator [bacterium]